MSWVFDHAQVSHRADLLVLLVLADHAREDGTGAYPSVDRVAAKARLNRRAAFDALRRLKDDGAIVAEGRGPKGTVSYSIVMQPTAPVQAAAPVQPAAQRGAVSRTQGVQAAAPEPSEPSLTRPPNPPRGADPAPVRPSGQRQRDLSRFEAEIADWSARHFPAASAGAVGAAVSWLRGRPGSPTDITAEAVHAFATTDPVWAEQLGIDIEGAPA